MRASGVARWTVLTAVLMAGLAGCGSSSSSKPAASSATASTPASSAGGSATSTATAATTAGGSGVTAPGTALSVGAPATVPYTPVSARSGSVPKYKLQVAVTSIAKGTLADFNGIKLDATQKASTPFYVKAKITNVGSGDAATPDNPAVEIQGVDGTGATQQSVIFFGTFPRCEYKTPAKPLSHGKSFETCLTFLVSGGIKKAAYTGTERYITAPVTWK